MADREKQNAKANADRSDKVKWLARRLLCFFFPFFFVFSRPQTLGASQSSFFARARSSPHESNQLNSILFFTPSVPSPLPPFAVLSDVALPIATHTQITNPNPPHPKPLRAPMPPAPCLALEVADHGGVLCCCFFLGGGWRGACVWMSNHSSIYPYTHHRSIPTHDPPHDTTRDTRNSLSRSARRRRLRARAMGSSSVFSISSTLLRSSVFL